MSCSNKQACLNGNLRFCENQQKVSDVEGKMCSIVDCCKSNQTATSDRCVAGTLINLEDKDTSSQIWMSITTIE